MLFLSDDVGHVVVSAMRWINPIPILVLFKLASTEDEVRALKLGTDDLLEKPYDFDKH